MTFRFISFELSVAPHSSIRNLTSQELRRRTRQATSLYSPPASPDFLALAISILSITKDSHPTILFAQRYTGKDFFSEGTYNAQRCLVPIEYWQTIRIIVLRELINCYSHSYRTVSYLAASSDIRISCPRLGSWSLSDIHCKRVAFEP